MRRRRTRLPKATPKKATGADNEALLAAGRWRALAVRPCEEAFAVGQETEHLDISMFVSNVGEDGYIANSSYKLTVKTIGKDWLFWGIYIKLHPCHFIYVFC